MFDRLQALLNRITTEASATSFIQSLKVMELFDNFDSWSDISTYIESGPAISSSVFIDIVESLILAGLDKILVQFTLHVDGNHVFKSIVLEGVKLLEDYDDHTAILAAIALDNSPAETMAELLAIVTPLTVDELLMNIMDVSPSLITAIKSRYNDEEIALEDNNTVGLEVNKKVAIQHYISTYPSSIAAYAITKEFLPYGITIETLLSKYRLPLQGLEPHAPEQAALELIGLVLISDAEHANIRTVVRNHIDFVYADMEFITKMNISIDNQLSQVLNHE